MTLKNVVLPAPLGPISAVIEPSRTPRLALSTARIPPNRFTTSSASKIKPFEAAGSPAAAAVAPSVTEHHLLSLAEHPLWSECHQPDEHDAEDDETQRRDSSLGQRELEEAQALEHRPQDHGAHGYPPVVRHSTEDQARVADEGDDRQELVRDDEPQVEREEETREGADGCRDRQRLQ